MSLLQFEAEMRQCSKCVLSTTRQNVTTWRGNSVTPKIMFVGEAAGQNEDEQGLPFVGAAGKQLDKLIIESGIDKIPYTITNVTRCRPPNNRRPTESEVTICTDAWLYQQIEMMKPRLIVPLGLVPASFFLQLPRDQLHMIEIHGASFLWHYIEVIPTYHPAATLYKNDLYPVLLNDLKKITVKYPSHRQILRA